MILPETSQLLSSHVLDLSLLWNASAVAPRTSLPPAPPRLPQGLQTHQAHSCPVTRTPPVPGLLSPMSRCSNITLQWPGYFPAAQQHCNHLQTLLTTFPSLICLSLVLKRDLTPLFLIYLSIRLCLSLSECKLRRNGDVSSVLSTAEFPVPRTYTWPSISPGSASQD